MKIKEEFNIKKLILILTTLLLLSGCDAENNVEGEISSIQTLKDSNGDYFSCKLILSDKDDVYELKYSLCENLKVGDNVRLDFMINKYTKIKEVYILQNK